MSGLTIYQAPPPVPAWASHAEALTWPISTLSGEDRQWRRGKFLGFPRTVADAVARRYCVTEHEQGLRAANLELAESYERCRIPGLPSPTAEAFEIRRLADLRASACGRLKNRPDREYYCHQHGVVPPSPHIDDTVALRRMGSPAWWVRQIRTRLRRAVEHVAIEAGLVQRTRDLYASRWTVGQIQQQRFSNRSVLEQLQIVNELGEGLPLIEVIDRSIANPVVRRAELMARMHGVETVARQQGLEATFATLTCPSRMHAYLATGVQNPAYDGTSPRDANKHLAQVWARVRAKLQRDGIIVVGFRVAEPHHDGTPHWHLMLFAPAGRLAHVEHVLRHYALADSPDEPGAHLRRVTFKQIDYARGSATGYLAKYISKNIDGYRLEENAAESKAAAVVAWASAWGIRQFQFYGVPPVGPYRELRCLGAPPSQDDDDHEPAGSHAHVAKASIAAASGREPQVRNHQCPETLPYHHAGSSGRPLPAAWAAADRGDFGAYIAAQGGLGTYRPKIRTVRRLPTYVGEPAAGDIAANLSADRYRRTAGRVVGVTDGIDQIETRPHEWRVTSRPDGDRGALEFCQ